MTKKRKRNNYETREVEREIKPVKDEEADEVEGEIKPIKDEETKEVEHTEEAQVETQLPKNASVDFRPKKFKPAYARVSVDPTRHYRTPESRESWGPNVKGKKFRKEKGKKKRCQNSGCRIDGAVKSTRLDV